MNNWLLTLLIASARESVQGRSIAACRYAWPILTLSLDPAGTAGSGGERLYLTSIFSRSGSFLFLSAADPLAGWPAGEVFPLIKRYTIASLEQVNDDRISRLRLRRPGHEDAVLDFILFSGAGNAILSAGGTVVTTLDRRTHHRSIPSQKAGGPVPFAACSTAALESALAAEEQVPGLDPRLVSVLSGQTAAAAAERLIMFRDAIARASQPFWLVCPPRLAEALPVPVPVHSALDGSTRIGPFSTCLMAAAAIGRFLIAKERATLIEQKLKPLGALIAKKRSLLHKLQEEKAKAEAHETIRRQAETLAAYQSRIPPGAASIELPDPYDDGVTLTIALDPSRPVRLQIEKQFKKASRMKRSLPILEGKTSSLRNMIDELETERTAIISNRQSAAVFDELDAALGKYRLRAKSGKASKPAEKQYRRYDLDPMWFVLVGRNNHENDELTFRVAAPSDHWLHAQRVPGSHVILKSNGSKTNPPESILQAAAGIAAYYSKAKHSSIVPVVHTQRKYVRKPKKAKPGQVICSQEKTIFAEPALPEEETA